MTQLRQTLPWIARQAGVVVLSLVLVACGGEDDEAAGGQGTAQAQAAPQGNRAPTISGSPTTSVAAGTAYAFQPSASDADNQPLSYSISNKPSWATFEVGTGRLSGTPGAGNVGSYGDIRISVSDGQATAQLAPFTLTVTAPVAPASGTPTISGSPSTSVREGDTYLFQPTAADPDGQSLTFSITNRPAWLAFDSATGRLTGTATSAAIGTYMNIEIAVSDGANVARLPAFTITVEARPAGRITISWSAPTQNTDGTPLADLAGYRIRYGTTASALDKLVDLANPTLTSHVIADLAPATYFVSVSSYNAAGVESAWTAPASKVIQ